jgi:hypothetical protein
MYSTWQTPSASYVAGVQRRGLENANSLERPEIPLCADTTQTHFRRGLTLLYTRALYPALIDHLYVRYNILSSIRRPLARPAL